MGNQVPSSFKIASLLQLPLRNRGTNWHRAWASLRLNHQELVIQDVFGTEINKSSDNHPGWKAEARMKSRGQDDKHKQTKLTVSTTHFAGDHREPVAVRKLSNCARRRAYVA